MVSLISIVVGLVLMAAAPLIDSYLVQKNWDSPYARLAPLFFFFLGSIASLLMSTGARAQGHAYTNYMRSGVVPYVYLQQGAYGEYGKLDDGKIKEPWRGYGVDTSLALETMKFIQFKAGHTFVGIRSRDDSSESLSGSRLHAGIGLSFLSPVANLEIGSGIQGSRLDYQNRAQSATFAGSGLYYSLGLNYFMTSKVSVYGEAKSMSDNLVRTSGAGDIPNFNTESRVMGLGFRIWL